jgi:photosystem II stability/assembly factor-like uncharacterized protein
MAIAIFFCLCICSLASAQQPAWQPIGPAGGNVLSLALGPQHLVYLGTPDGHLFRSVDSGAQWTLLSRVSSRHDAVIQKLLVDRQHPQTLFAAVWFQEVSAGGALYRSVDGGVTWSVAGLSGEILRTVEQSVSAPEIFVAGTRSGVFRSLDSGQSWQRISPAGDPELRNVDSLAIDPRDPQTIYAGTYHLPWKTTDAGRSWLPVAAGMIDDSDVMSLRVDASSSSRVFASACSGIYRSENAGAQWTKLQGIPYSSRRTPALVQDPQNPQVLYAATTEGLWLTRDGGESWARTTPRDWIVNDVVVLSPLNPSSAARAADSATSSRTANSVNSTSRVLLATEAQGLLVSDDGGLTFTPANAGFSHRITAALVGDPRDAGHLLAWQPGSPDPLVATRDAGATWQPLPAANAADAAAVARLFSTDAGWWFADPAGQLFLYDSRSATWLPFRYQPALSPRPARARGNPQSPGPASSRNAPRRLASFPKFAPPTMASQIYDLVTRGARVFVATPQALWSGTLGENILRPEEFPSVQELSAPPASAGGAAQTPAALWLCAANKILFSETEGPTWQEDPQPIAANIHADGVRWLREAPAGNSSTAATGTSVLLAATIKGLYRRDPITRDWQLLQNGLPAGEPIAYAFREKLWLIALRAGGLYASRDAGQTWDRLDLGPISGPFSGIAVTRDGRVVSASRTEGLFAALF